MACLTNPAYPALIDAHPNFEQSLTMSLHEPEFRFVIDIRLSQHQRGYHFGLTYPGRSSNHTGSRGRSPSPSWTTSIGNSPTIAISSLATPANTLGVASTDRCVMFSLPSPRAITHITQALVKKCGDSDDDESYSAGMVDGDQYSFRPRHGPQCTVYRVYARSVSDTGNWFCVSSLSVNPYLYCFRPFPVLLKWAFCHQFYWLITV
ncbi:hypothetical protein BJV77DRAFT_318545 [Russula vinacea]|nr:hypothetical protein BJV77DRAFT_318545 [Russula vinacea]